MCPVHSPDFSEKPAVSADQAAGPRQRPHPITRGLSQQEPPAYQQSLTYAGEREGSYKAYSELNRIHKGRSVWGKANPFHRRYFCEGRRHVTTTGPSTDVQLGSGRYLLTSVQCLQCMWHITAWLSRGGATPVEGHSNAVWKTWKQQGWGNHEKLTQTGGLLLFLFRKNFDQNLKQATPNACFIFIYLF